MHSRIGLASCVTVLSICKLWKVNTKENKSDLLMKIHGADQFKQLCNHCMVFKTILMGQPADTDSLQVQVCGTSN